MLKKITLLVMLPLIIGMAFALWYFDNAEKDKPATAFGNFGGDFTLTSAQGSVSLNDFRGKLVVLYFGYTYCPDICPTSLGMISAALNRLTPEERTKIQPLFVTVDPARDSTEQMRLYVRHFYEGLIGLTGTSQEIAEVAKQYGVYYKKAELEGSAMGYAMDHSSSIYVIGPDGKMVDLLNHADNPDALVTSLRKALANVK